MSLSHRIILPLAIVSLALLVACGNSNNGGPAPNQQGFANSNLTGTYVFFFQGWDSFGFAPLTIKPALLRPTEVVSLLGAQWTPLIQLLQSTRIKRSHPAPTC